MALDMIRPLKLVATLNFFISVLVLVISGLLSVSDYSIFDFNEDLYGALDNNLRMIMFYLAIAELVVLAYAFLSKTFKSMILVGFFLILMIGSLQFYGEVNSVGIDEKFPVFLLYIGLSHILFGAIAVSEQQSVD